MIRHLARTLITSAVFSAAVQAQSAFQDPIEVSQSLARTGDGLVIADINHDGHADLLALYRPANGLRILLGNGDGTFDAPYDLPLVNGYAQELVAADFSGDGRTDIAVDMGSGSGKLVWLENNGTPTPLLRAINLSTDSVLELVPADVDGDGDLDLVVHHFFSVAFYRNLGGAFDPTSNVIASGAVRAIECADIDGDGGSDVLLARRVLTGGPLEYEWRVALTDGTGGYSAEVPFLPSAVDGLLAIQASDLDSDGDQDLVGFAPISDEMIVLESVGHLTFGSPNTFSAPGIQVTAIRPDLVDVDGDGLVDALYPAQNALGDDLGYQWRKGLGGVSFGPILAAMDAPVWTDVAFADLNADGVPEAVVQQDSFEHRIFQASSAGLGPRRRG